MSDKRLLDLGSAAQKTVTGDSFKVTGVLDAAQSMRSSAVAEAYRVVEQITRRFSLPEMPNLGFERNKTLQSVGIGRPGIATAAWSHLPELAALHPFLARTNPVNNWLARLDELRTGAFRFPEWNELTLLRQSIRDHTGFLAMLPTRTHFDEISRLAAGIPLPWVAIDHPSDSFIGLANLAVLGRALNANLPFGATLTKALRSNLGDWRGVTTDESLIDDYAARSTSYYGRGFDPRLTAFAPGAFDTVMQHAGVAAAEPPKVISPYHPQHSHRATEVDLPAPPKFMRDAYQWIAGFESHIRAFIDRRMTAACGPQWVKHRVPGELRKRWEEKRQSDRDAGMREAPLIAYAEFTDYVAIIIRNDNWTEIFARVFRRRSFIEESFNRIQPFRVCTMHSRTFIEEDKLLLHVELRRLMRAMQVAEGRN